MSQLTADTAYSFLLGELTDDAYESLESRIFEDDELFDAMSTYEADLIDAYLQDLLTSSRRASFERRYLGHSEQRHKVEAARALRAVMASAGARKDAPPLTASTERPWWLLWLFDTRSAPAWALVAASVAAIVLMRSAAEPVVIPVSLLSDSVRARATVRSLVLPDTEGWIHAELARDGETASPTSVRLLYEGRTVWTGPPTRTSSVAVWTKIPFSSFAEGRFTIELWGGGRSSESFIAAYPLTIASPNDAGASP
ncbi:MAG: hypothetical protein AAF449_21220 [Myxococcota bacterium]